ncbi:MAG: S24 family peptidase [bacterium]|nr:S24 family peptidase [bacterium]
MSFKESIGNRITQARKAIGITIKELAARTQSLGAARISNWEQGTRSPGPIEAKILSDHLKVSASWLLCLTDNPQGELSQNIDNGLRYIPVMNIVDAANTNERRSNTSTDRTIVIDCFNQGFNSKDLFAVRVEDNSMQPDFNVNDIVVINADAIPKPGDYVLALLTSKKQTILRKYSEADSCIFQLLASNELWATINIYHQEESVLLGKVVERRSYL